MKTVFGIAATVGFTFLILSSPTAQQVYLLNLLRQFWWVLPVSSAFSSFLVLGAAALAEHSKGRRKANWLSTQAYLVSCPSLAVVGFIAMFLPAASPPTWTGSVILAVLLCSAWMYFRTTEDKEDESERNLPAPSFAFLGV